MDKIWIKEHGRHLRSMKTADSIKSSENYPHLMKSKVLLCLTLLTVFRQGQEYVLPQFSREKRK